MHQEHHEPMRRRELYYVLNRGNGCAEIFHEPEVYAVFERILAEGWAAYSVKPFCFQLMPNHWHRGLQPAVDGELSQFVRWISATQTMRYLAHYLTSGQGHVYQGRFKGFPSQDNDHVLTFCRYVKRNAVRARIQQHVEDWRWGLLMN